MSVYAQELSEAEQKGLAAFETMEVWLNRPLDGPDVAGAVLDFSTI